MFLVALLIASLAPSREAPPPTIVTVKSSPFCQAVRQIVAPVIYGLKVQNRMLSSGNGLAYDMALMESEGGGSWAEMDNVHLSRIVGDVAHNNIVIHQQLDALNDTKLSDAREVREVAELRERLLAVADKQAQALNLLSGTTDSYSANELLNLPNPIGGGQSPSAYTESLKPVRGAAATVHGPATKAGDTSAGNGAHKTSLAYTESQIMPALAPVIQRCI